MVLACETFVTRLVESYVNEVTPPVGAVIEVRSPLVYPKVVFAPVASVYVVMSPAAFFTHDTRRELEPEVCVNVVVPFA